MAILQTPRQLLIIQLLGTLLILALIPTSTAKLLGFLILWAICFRKVSLAELAFFSIASIFFTVMNTMSLRQGIFEFTHPDILGMPYYELFMWGFYLLHTWRMIGKGSVHRVTISVWILALLYSASFALIQDQNLLLIITTILLSIGLFLYHEKKDLASTFYMIALGATIEYTGVLSGQWHYPGEPVGGVPFWFITLWGGVGLLLHRLAIPLVYHFQQKSNMPTVR